MRGDEWVGISFGLHVVVESTSTVMVAVALVLVVVVDIGSMLAIGVRVRGLHRVAIDGIVTSRIKGGVRGMIVIRDMVSVIVVVHQM